MKNMDVTKEIESLIKKGQLADKSDDALKFSQAACNAANAVACVRRWWSEPLTGGSTDAEKEAVVLTKAGSNDMVCIRTADGKRYEVVVHDDCISVACGTLGDYLEVSPAAVTRIVVRAK